MEAVKSRDNKAAIFTNEEVKTLLTSLREYRVRSGLSRVQLAVELAVPYSTLKKWLAETRSAPKPSQKSLKRITEFLERAEAKRRTEIIRGLLLALEDQLRWFRDVQRIEGRGVLRESLDYFDVGYVTSLLTMLSEEEKFERWLHFNNYEFQGFRGC